MGDDAKQSVTVWRNFSRAPKGVSGKRMRRGCHNRLYPDHISYCQRHEGRQQFSQCPKQKEGRFQLTDHGARPDTAPDVDAPKDFGPLKGGGDRPGSRVPQRTFRQNDPLVARVIVNTHMWEGLKKQSTPGGVVQPPSRGPGWGSIGGTKIVVFRLDIWIPQKIRSILRIHMSKRHCTPPPHQRPKQICGAFGVKCGWDLPNL